MVYYVNEASSISDYVNDFKMAVMESYHQCEMDIITDKYNYVMETGYIMPVREAEEKAHGRIATFFINLKNNIVKFFKGIWNKLTSIGKKADNESNPAKKAKIKSKVNEAKAKVEKVEKDVNNTVNNAEKVANSTDDPAKQKQAMKDATEAVNNNAEEVKTITAEIIDTESGKTVGKTSATVENSLYF